MTDHWKTTFDDVRHRLRRIIILRGVAWSVVTLLLAVGLVTFTDWSLHLDSPWLRLALLALVVAVTGFVIWGGLIRPLRVPLSDVTIARLIERQHPGWNEELSSAAQFRQSTQASAGASAELQRRAITQAAERLRQADLDGLYRLQQVWVAVSAAAVVGLIAGATTLSHPAETAIALRRLAMPLGSRPWPRTTQLALLGEHLDPVTSAQFKTSAGQPLQFYVEDRLDELPVDLQLHVRTADGHVTRQTLRTTLLRDRRGHAHEVGVVRLLAHTDSLQFRVTGGDDDSMDWRTVEVVPAPGLEALTITVVPPAYSGLPPQTYGGAGLIEGLVGSRLMLEGRANKSLTQARLHSDRLPLLPLTIGVDQRTLSAEFTLDQPGRLWYWFSLTDHDGLQIPDPTHYELRGIADREPVVTIDQPVTDLAVTSKAQVPLRVVARDDVGLRQIRLMYGVDDRDPASLLLFSAATPVSEHSANINWELAPLQLTPGSQVEYVAEAFDACPGPDQSLGQIGRSARRTLYVVSDDAKRQELAARQSGILGTIDDLRERQTRAAERVVGLRIQQERAGELRPQDIDLLKSVELEQHQIAEQLTLSPAGARAGLQVIEAELDANRLEDAATKARLDQLTGRLDLLAADWLPKAEQSLARARKSAPTSPSETGTPANGVDSQTPIADISGESDASTSQWLQEAEQAQASVVDILQGMTRDLEGWRRRFELSSALDDLIGDQSALHQETQDIGRGTLAHTRESLTPQQQADLERLAERQRRLAERLASLDAATTSSPSGGRRSEDAVSSSSSPGTPAPAHPESLTKMQAATESLRRNEIPQAVAAQEQVLQDLRNSVDRLADSTTDDPQQRVDELRERVSEVDTLRKQQEQLNAEAHDTLTPSADPDRQERLERLQKRQSELADEVDSLARRLQQDQLDAAARAAAQASRRMHQADEALTRQDPQSVDENQQNAAHDLRQAANQVAQALQNAEQLLAFERLGQLTSQVTDWTEQQSVLLEATRTLDREYAERTRWSRPLRKTLQDTTQQQADLAAHVQETLAEIPDDPVLLSALTGASDQMADAEQLLRDEQTGEATQFAQQAAHQRLEAVQEVLTRQTSPSLADAQREESSTSPEQRGEGKAMLPPVLQLRLLREWQAEINQRTTGLIERRADEAASSDDQQRRLATLAEEQQRIAELTRTLIEEWTAEPPASAPQAQGQ